MMNLNSFKKRLEGLEHYNYGSRCVVTYTRDDEIFVFQDGEAKSMTPLEFEEFKLTCSLPLVDIGRHDHKEGYRSDVVEDPENIILHYLNAYGGNA